MKYLHLTSRIGALVGGALLGFWNTAPARADLPLGSSFAGVNRPANWRETALPPARTLQALGLRFVRVGMDYGQDPAELADMLAICEKHGLRPQLLVEYYPHFGDLKRGKATVYEFWNGLGRDLATRWGRRIAFYSAFNEPDLLLFYDGKSAPVNDPRGKIPLDDYFQAMKGFADGIHEVDRSLKVIPGGYAGQFFHGDYTNRGYSQVLAPLFNDGTLDGLNLHRYGDNVKDWARSQQDLFDQTKKASGITRDINHYCDEFNGGPSPAMFLNYMWNAVGIVGNAGDGSVPKTVFAMPYSLFELRADQEYGLAKSLEPWQPTENGQALQLVLALTKGMEIKASEPYNSGLMLLSGANKTMWTWQNFAAYSKIAGKYLTLRGLPRAARTLKIYRATDTLDKPMRTIALKNQTSLDLAGLPTDEVLMLVADAAHAADTGPRRKKFPVLKLDFTSHDGPVARGYTRFAPQPYSKILGGYGYANPASVYTSQNEAGSALDRSGHNSDADRTLLVDVPPGRYRVTIRLGSTKEARAGLNVAAQGEKKVQRLATKAGEVQARRFDVAAPNGQIKLDFSGTQDAPGGKGWFVTALEVTPIR